MIITLIICITIVLVTMFLSSVNLKIRLQEINNRKYLDEYKLNCIYTKDSSVNDIYSIKRLVDKINMENIFDSTNKKFIETIKDILETYDEEDIDYNEEEN